MSVQVNTYVLRGAVLSFDLVKGRYDELEPYTDSAFEGIHHHDGICMLDDGMNGRYVAIGRVIAKTENHGHFEEIIAIPPPGEAPASDALLKEAIEKIVGVPVVIGDYVISHYR